MTPAPRHPRSAPGRAHSRLVLIAALLFGALAGGIAGSGCGKRDAGDAEKRDHEGTAIYHCPMHPTYTSDRPGDCPICNMRLVRIGSDDPHVPSHDTVTAAPDTAGSAVEGYAPIAIAPEVAQRIGVRLARAEQGPQTRTIRTVGRVEADESRIHHVHTRVEGWVRRVYVATTGQTVRAGQPLLSLYSPELVATQEEYLAARRLGESGRATAESARRRLLLFGLDEEQIHALEAAASAPTEVDLKAHGGGVVVEKRVVDGMRVMPGEELYTIADLSQVWVTASIYEYELPLVKKGQEATVTLSYQPGVVRRGQISYVYPYLDENTRTAQVRLEFANQSVTLKPGMYADVEIQVPVGESVTIPRDAVLDSGDRRIVFVARGGGRYEPRTVSLGPRLGDLVVVNEGVRAGEEVVVGAHFLIDSESRLKAALAGSDTARATPPAHGSH